MMNRIAFASLLALVAAPSSGAAQEAPYTFEVPVRLEAIHPMVEEVRVGCWVGEELPPFGQEITTSGQVAGNGDLSMAPSAFVPDRAGVVQGTATVSFAGESAARYQVLLNARYYRCYFWFTDDDYLGRPEEGTPTTSEQAMLFAKPGTLVGYQEGLLPGRN